MSPWGSTRRKAILPSGERVPAFVPWDGADPRFTREHMREHRDDFRAQCLWIRTKKDGLRRYHENYTQRLIDSVIREEREAGRRPQIICLKSRQVGVSTKAVAEGFEDTFLTPDRETFIITDTLAHSKLMIQMARRFFRHLPAAIKPNAKDMRLENVHGIQFPWDSRIQVEAEGDAHSMTANILHFSEFAYFKRPDDTLKEAMPAVPNDPSSLILMESTANGQGNEFYDIWCRAIEAELTGKHKNESGWRAVFVPWWKHEEYLMKPWFLPGDTTVRERELARRFSLNMRQIAWRRYTIEAIFKGDEDEFETRYPTTWEEAFKRSGRPVFDPEQMDRLLDQAPPRKNEGSVWVLSNPCEIEWDEAQKKPKLVDASNGRLRVFKDFNPRHTYVLSGDPSEGDRKSDPSPLELIDVVGTWTKEKRGSIDQVAEWWGRTPPDVLAKYAAWLGMLYGDAMIGGESTGVGLLFFTTLEAMGYPNLFMRQTHEEDVSGAITLKPGIAATNKAKHAAIGTFRAWLRECRGEIYSPILLGEMGTAVYFRREQTTMGGAGLVTQITKPSNKHIDTVMAFAWALWMFRGSEANPLLPLPEKVLVSAAAQVMLARERGAADHEQIAMDLTGMSGDDLMHVLDVRHKRRAKLEAKTGWAR